MNKENKKMAQERRARERAKQEQKKKIKDILGLWGPIVLIAATVVVLIIAIVASDSVSDDDYGDDEPGSGFVYIDENGNEIMITDATEVEELDTTADRVVEPGDKVNIDYVGKIDGVAFEGGDTRGMGEDLEIGSGTSIDGFEDAIIGHKVGETFDLTVTFPDPYLNNTDLSGKEAVFTTTINGVYD